MNCPKCNHYKTGVKKTWHEYDGKTIYRRRECPECYAQFETAESARVLEIQNAFDSIGMPLFEAKTHLIPLIVHIWYTRFVGFVVSLSEETLPVTARLGHDMNSDFLQSVGRFMR